MNNFRQFINMEFLLTTSKRPPISSTDSDLAKVVKGLYPHTLTYFPFMFSLDKWKKSKIENISVILGKNVFQLYFQVFGKIRKSIKICRLCTFYLEINF